MAEQRDVLEQIARTNSSSTRDRFAGFNRVLRRLRRNLTNTHLDEKHSLVYAYRASDGPDVVFNAIESNSIAIKIGSAFIVRSGSASQ